MPTYTLGRLLQHDERSRQYPYRAAHAAPLKSVQHQSHIGILDQGSTGSCTGQATIAALGCDPFYATISATLDEAAAVSLYSAASILDEFPGWFNPATGQEDTGSSGVAAAKAAKKVGLIAGYQHTFTVADALAALQLRPVICGVPWYQSFFTPTDAGLVSIMDKDTVVGGHEICADGYDAERALIWFRNSWGTGYAQAGRFCMTVATFTRLLAEQGDVTVFIPLDQPAPKPEPIVNPTPAPYDDPHLSVWWAATKDWAYARHAGSNKAAAATARALAARKGLI